MSTRVVVGLAIILGLFLLGPVSLGTSGFWNAYSIGCGTGMIFTAAFVSQSLDRHHDRHH